MELSITAARSARLNQIVQVIFAQLLTVNKLTASVISLDFGRAGGGADQHEVVVHHRKSLDGKAFCDDFFLGDLVVNEQHVGVAPATHVDGLAGADRHHFHIDSGGLFVFLFMH